MIKRINIYLTNDEKALIRQKMHHYHVSLSTICQKCAFAFMKMINQGKTLENLKERIDKEYIDRPKTIYKTSCKPKDQELIKNFIKNPHIYYTNVIRMYVNKTVKNYFTEKGTQEIYNYINAELTNCKELHWDYNNYVRNSMRFFKDNKPYIERKLKEIQ